MTTDELNIEWRYRFNERVAIQLEGNRLTDPTPEQMREIQAIARREADAWLRDWRRSEMLL